MTHNDFCEQLSAELEDEYANRIQEINTIENFFKMNTNDPHSNLSGIMRKSLVLLLYAHFEGYCKQAFQYYIIYINKKQIPISRLKFGLATANLNAEFRKLFDVNHKPVNIKMFSSDSAIQQFGRKREFLANYDLYVGKIININEDFINTEANLKPDVLKKILFQLELDSSAIDVYLGEIYKLINIRNSFAHGELVRYPDEEEYDKYKNAALETMKNIKFLVETSFCKQAFLKAI